MVNSSIALATHNSIYIVSQHELHFNCKLS